MHAPVPDVGTSASTRDAVLPTRSEEPSTTTLPTRVSFDGEAGRLSAVWHPRPTTAPVVVLVHGYASKAVDLWPVAPTFAAAGWHVLALDLRGHGESDPSTTRPRPPALARDVDAAVDWLHGRDDVTSVGLLGHSMGGSTVILSASGRDDVAAVVTVAAVADPTLTRIAVWPAWVSRQLLRTMGRRHGIDPSATFAVNRLPHVAAPVLLLHGTRDRVVPIRHLDALQAADPARSVLRVPGAGHRSIDAFVGRMQTVIDFLGPELAGYPTVPGQQSV